jgi:type II secretory pathway pseudopilin PulG
MKYNSPNGFTIVEFAAVAVPAIIAITAFFPAFLVSKHDAFDAEAKANLHTIQIAVERYGVDMEEFPPYLLGGDFDGWEAWHRANDAAQPNPGNPANNWVLDPLVEYDYLSSYPSNPFIDDNSPMEIIAATSFKDDYSYGDGDPRFGYKGNVMGNGLDDPFFFEDAHPNLPYSRIETKRTLDRGGKVDPVKYGFPNKNAGTGNRPGLYYNFGGRYDQNTRKECITFWPGEFFYKAIPTIIPARKGWSLPYPNQVDLNGFDNARHYILGVWGYEGNKGIDAIRLQEVTPDQDQEQVFWRLPPPWPGDKDYPCGYTGRAGEPLGLPAVFGGGDATHGPFWPPDKDPASLGSIIYGAPDGMRDGLIMTLTSERIKP